MSYLIVLLAFVFTGSSVRGSLNRNAAGPYDVLVLRVGNCDDIGSGDVNLTVKVSRANRTSQVLNGHVEIKQLLNNENRVIATLAQFTNGGWKENYFRKELPALCDGIKFFVADLSLRVARSMGQKGKHCPIPPKLYEIKNLNLFIEIKAVPVFFYNKYRFQGNLYKKDAKIGCLSLTVDVVPKKPKKG